MTTFEEQYIELLDLVYNYGITVPNERTGTTTKAIFDAKLVVSEGEFPFSTIRPASPRLAFEEFWFFLNGKTDTTELEEKGIFFWQGNTRRDYLDNIGLNYVKEGHLGRAYSCQFRDFGGAIHDGVGVDQVKQTWDTLKNDPYSRRMYNVIWNPAENHLGCITPCWLSHQFAVLPENGLDTLHLKLTSRSNDILFGLTFAVQQYRLYQMALAKAMGMEVGRLVCDMSHVHIYENQFEYVEETLEREFYFQYGAYDIKRIKLNKDLTTFEYMLNIKWDDWEIDMPTVNTKKYNTPRPPMVA